MSWNAGYSATANTRWTGGRWRGRGGASSMPSTRGGFSGVSGVSGISGVSPGFSGVSRGLSPSRGSWRASRGHPSSRGDTWRSWRSGEASDRNHDRDRNRDPTPLTRSPPLPRGPLLCTLQASDLVADADELQDAARITGVQHVSSYSWLDAPSPTILVPGLFYRDGNAARYPAHPMEPAVLAALAADPALPRTIDIVACGSTLGSLLRFVRGVARSFRMLAEVVEGTLFLVRRENTPDEPIDDMCGYGHAFVEAYASWAADVRGSQCHHSLVRYSFGGLDLLVRFEADAYHGEEKETKKGRGPAMDMNDLLTRLDRLGRLCPAKGTGVTEAAGTAGLTIRRGGQAVDHSRLVDIKTRSVFKLGVEDTLALELPRLWVRQVDHFVLAHHTHGRFDHVDATSVRDRVRAWESDAAQRRPLGLLAALLHRVVEATLAAPGRRMEVLLADRAVVPGEESRADDRKHKFEVYSDEAVEGLVLEFRAQLPGVESALSAATEKRWEAACLSESEEDESDDESDDEDEDEPASSENVSWYDGSSEPDGTASSADSS